MVVGYHRCEQSAQDTGQHALMSGYASTQSQYLGCVRICQCGWMLWIAILGSVLAVDVLYLCVGLYVTRYADLVVFVAGVLVGIVAFKQDWDTQAREAQGFMGGRSRIIVHRGVALTVREPRQAELLLMVTAVS
jgi:hypothetical protein